LSLSSIKDPNIVRSEGRGMCFFISTDDSKIIIKTLKDEEKDLLNSEFLSFYLHHLQTNQNSLICRIYGIYNVITDYYNDSIYVMIMRDASGPLSKVL
jgi:hypothetical protein